MAVFQFELVKDGKLRKMRGEKINDYFGMDYRVGKGWMITHIPTGYLITDVGFIDRESAEYFVSLAEKSYGDLLAQTNPHILEDNQDIDDGMFYELRIRLENIEDRPVNKDDINIGIAYFSNRTTLVT